VHAVQPGLTLCYVSLLVLHGSGAAPVLLPPIFVHGHTKLPSTSASARRCPHEDSAMPCVCSQKNVRGAHGPQLEWAVEQFVKHMPQGSALILDQLRGHMTRKIAELLFDAGVEPLFTYPGTLLPRCCMHQHACDQMLSSLQCTWFIAGTADELSPFDAGFFAIAKLRAKKRLHRIRTALGRKLTLAEVEEAVGRALQDSIPTLHSFFRKAQVVDADATPLSSLERLPRQLALSTRLPFGDVPDGASVTNISGFSKEERLRALPARSLPGDAAAAGLTRTFVASLLTSELGVSYAVVAPPGDSPVSLGFLQSLALCAALRDAHGEASRDRAELDRAASSLLRLPTLSTASATATASSAAGSC